jgi:hypothetical protein
MADFKQRVAEWRRMPFPPGSSIDTLDELHADLVVADSWVAESAIPYLERGVYDPAEFDVLKELRILRDRAANETALSDEAGRELARRYVVYAEVLIRVYVDFLEQQPGR